MTKMVIENSEELPLLSHDVKFMPDPVWMEMKRRRASLVVSCAYLLKMDKKAIYNKMINSGLTLPVKDKFRKRKKNVLKYYLIIITESWPSKHKSKRAKP
jgi:hypothetical protein